MLNIIQNTIGAIRRVGESVVRAGLKMWLPFTKAEPLGEDLVVNGDFATNSDWSFGANTTITGGKLVCSNSSAYNSTSQSISMRAGTYIVTYTIDSISGGVIYLGFDGVNGVNRNTSGTYTEYLEVPSNSSNLYIVPTANGIEFEISNVSVEEYAQETPDISGNDNNAILKTGKALEFTGNDSVETSFPSSYTIKTIAFWIKPTHSSTNETVFYGGGGMGGTRQLYLDHLQLEAINSNISMSTYVNGSFEGVTANGTPATLTQDEWQRVVLTSSTGFSVVSDTFDIASGLYGHDGRFVMSDLQIYDEAWTTDDIAYDYANPQKLVTDSEDTSITLDNLKAWWHLSEGDGTIAFDSAPLLGKELVVNGDFSTDSDWTKENGWNIENGKATKSGSASSALIQNIDIPNGSVFQLAFDLSGVTDGHLKAEVFGGGGNDSFFNILDISNGSYSFTTTTTTDRESFQFYAYGNFDGSIDNVSIKEVFNIDGETYDGNSLGASYVDAQERVPQLGMMNWSKGSNLLTYSEDFTNSYWTKDNVTVENSYLAPDGTLSAYKISADSSGQGFGYKAGVNANGKTKTIWAKTVSGSGQTCINIKNDYTGALVTITNEWQRFEQPSSVVSNDNFYLVDFRHASNTLDEVIVWGAQLEESSSATAYRRTNGTAVTDATLISSATDSQKDILGNAVRVKGSGFNLDGTGYGEVTHDTSLDFGTGDFSVSAWVKFSYISQGSSYNAIYTNGGQLDATNTFAIMTVNPNRVRVLVNNTFCQSTTYFSQGEWVHMVATRNSGTISLYINGNKTPEATATNSNTVTSSQNPRIGFDGNVSRLYNDLIDDVQVYNRALTPDEVEQNYNATKTGHNN